MMLQLTIRRTQYHPTQGESPWHFPQTSPPAPGPSTPRTARSASPSATPASARSAASSPTPRHPGPRRERHRLQGQRLDQDRQLRLRRRQPRRPRPRRRLLRRRDVPGDLLRLHRASCPRATPTSSGRPHHPGHHPARRPSTPSSTAWPSTPSATPAPASAPRPSQPQGLRPDLERGPRGRRRAGQRQGRHQPGTGLHRSRSVTSIRYAWTVLFVRSGRPTPARRFQRPASSSR